MSDMTADMTADRFAQKAFDYGLVDNTQIEGIWSELGTREVTLEEFVSVFLRKQLLTNLQVDRIKKGERYGYFYGKYKVLYVVGAGSFARVYRAEHVDKGEVVALKVLRNRFANDRETVQHFLDEARMVMKLRHLNIVPVYEVETERNRPYMVMEFVEGQNLREYLKVRKKLEVDESLSILEDIAAGLEYAAKQGVTHRDMKISNILVSSAKRGKIVDFGLAAVEAGTKDNAVSQRSIDYVGLERATSVRKNDARSDLYFAGCILYQLLTGVPPFPDTRDRAQRLNISRFREVKPILDVDRDLPPNVAQFVTKAMELDADKRFQTPAELLNEVRILRHRIQSGVTEVGVAAEATDAAGGKRKVEREGENHSVMVIESNIEMQDALRDLLKRRGYRVLVISDTERALQRYEIEPPAECAIFCTTELGQDAIDGFVKFGEMEHTRELPAILFLDETRSGLKSRIKETPHRRILLMPLKVRQLRMALMQLLQQGQADEE